MKLRQEERLSGEALQQHLQAEYGITSSWVGVHPDPPDLRFDITRPTGAKESWAVEVTGLVQYIDWQGNEVNRRVFEPAIFRMCQSLNDELGSNLTSTYCLSVTGPFDATVFRDLENRVRAYIQSGKSDEEALDYFEAEASVLKEIKGDPNDPLVQWAVQQVVKDRIKVTIKAIPGVGKIVVLSGISGVAKIPNTNELAADVAATLRYTTSRILDQKIPRMAKVSGYDRKVLLVWSAIPFADVPEIENQFRVRHPTCIDGIFLVELGKDRVSLILDLGLMNSVP